MKKIIILFFAASTAITGAKAQRSERLSFATTIGTGIAINAPASTPFTWQMAGYYNFNSRLSAGVGTGLSAYEKILIPLFGSVKFNIIKPRKLTPYIECSAGYGFAPGKNTNGGFYLNPSAGMLWAIGKITKLSLALGYETQHLERLKKQENEYFRAEFAEKLNHNNISIKAGFIF